MSIAPVDIIMGRIKAATPESPIAVFRTSTPGTLNAVFARTSATVAQIRRSTGFLGVFHKNHNQRAVKRVLQAAVKPPPKSNHTR